MEFFLLALLALTSAIAQAASIKAASIEPPSRQAASAEKHAAQDAYVAKIEAITADGNPDDETSKLHDLATEQPGKLVTSTIGPIRAKGGCGRGDPL